MPTQEITHTPPCASNRFKSTYETNTPEAPITAYMRTKVKITLPSEVPSYSALIQSLKSRIEAAISDEVKKCAYWHPNHIIVVDISDKGLRYRDSCFLKYEVNLRAAYPMTWSIMKDRMTDLSEAVNNRILYCLHRCHIQVVK